MSMELNSTIIIIVLLGVLVALVLGLACVPVRLRIWLGTDVKKLTVKFLKYTIIDSDSPRKSSGGTKKKEKASESQAKSDMEDADKKPPVSLSERWEKFLRFVDIAPQIARAVLGFTIRLVKKLNLRDVAGSVAGGFSDPADTGMAFGALYAIWGAAPCLQSRISVQPDYQAERITYDLHGAISLRPIALVWPTARLLYDLPKRELVKMIRESRRKRRKAEASKNE